MGLVTTILVATATGLRRFAGDGLEGSPELEGRRVRALATEGWNRLWAIVEGHEIWRDGEGRWQRMASLDAVAGAEGLEAVCIADTRANKEGGLLLGTSKARLLRIGENAEVEFVGGFDRAPGRDGWYTPWGGPPDTRSISEDRQSVFVNVHVGGVLRSRDGGRSWEPTIDVDADVHQVATGEGRVYAAGAHGLSVSPDGGDTWSLHAEGLHARYCRAVAVCGKHLLLSASDGPRGSGRAGLYRADLEGSRFERCSEGLPEWFRGNLDSGCVDALPDGKLAAFGTTEGELYSTADEGGSWTRITAGLGGIAAVRVLP